MPLLASMETVKSILSQPEQLIPESRGEFVNFVSIVFVAYQLIHNHYATVRVKMLQDNF